MTPRERPYLAAAYWLQMREERLHREFNPYRPSLRNVWTAQDDTQFTAAYRIWLREGRMA